MRNWSRTHFRLLYSSSPCSSPQPSRSRLTLCILQHGGVNPLPLKIAFSIQSPEVVLTLGHVADPTMVNETGLDLPHIVQVEHPQVAMGSLLDVSPGVHKEAALVNEGGVVAATGWT